MLRVSLILIAFATFTSQIVAQTTRPERVYLDPSGVIRWTDTKQEVHLFGANYCLASSTDYRAAGYVHADRALLAAQDMAHFARMGFDAVRLSFWGDYEASDPAGNLIANDHLDVLDHCIDEADRNGISILLSPITTYDSLWPEMKSDPAVVGFSRHFNKSILGTDPAAIAAQQNYLRQLLNHINPYTHHAIKNEPAILFIEMINEPNHHSNDFSGSIAYINTLVKAVRDTGCTKLTFHNLSQDFGMADAINASQADGETFAWYPSGLNAGHQLQGNFLPYVDQYPPMMAAKVQHKPRLVYEFDLPDVISGYHYPAMARVFRETGAQWATMFSYDMLATAPYNLGWTTHLLNLAYTPQKAAAAVIASAAMHELPAGKTYGAFPDDLTFDHFRVSYPQNLAELVSETEFLYSNDTTTAPPAPASLRRIVGYGSSSIVHTDSRGIYFLDRISAGRWRLENYPDAIQVDDPFHAPKLGDVKFRLIDRQSTFTVDLPDLGHSFHVQQLNNEPGYSTAVSAGSFSVPAGAWLLDNTQSAGEALPDHVNGVPLRRFICPAAMPLPTTLLHTPARSHSRSAPLEIKVAVVCDDVPDSVKLLMGQDSFDMSRIGKYEYELAIHTSAVSVPLLHYKIAVRAEGNTITSAEYETSLVGDNEGISLFDPVRDTSYFAQSRSASKARLITQGEIAASLGAPGRARQQNTPATYSLFIGERISERGADAANANAISIKVRSQGSIGKLHLTLVDQNGFAWGANIGATSDWQIITVPLAALKPDDWVLLPQGYPGSWAYIAPHPSTPRPAVVDPARLERLQITHAGLDQINVSSITLQTAGTPRP